MKGIKEAYITSWGGEKWLTGLSPSWDSRSLPPLSHYLSLIFSLLLPLSASGCPAGARVLTIEGHIGEK